MMPDQSRLSNRQNGRVRLQQTVKQSNSRQSKLNYRYCVYRARSPRWFYIIILYSSWSVIIKKQEDKIVYEIIKIHLEKLYRRLEENANSCHEITIAQNKTIYIYALPSSLFSLFLNFINEIRYV